MGGHAAGTRAVLALAAVLAAGTGLLCGPAAQRAAARQVAGSAAAAAPYNPVIGTKIVEEAEHLVAGGSPWPFGCAASGGCIPYSWGGGHGTSPGPSQGICGTGWEPASPLAPKDLYDGPRCAAADNANGAPNGTYGLDCSGFTRWVYDLVYGTDILGQTTTSTQPYRPGMRQVPAADREPGDLLLNPGHIAIYIGDYTSGSGARRPAVIDEPHAYDQRPGTTGSHLGDWVLAYARVDDMGATATATATYWRYTGKDPRGATSQPPDLADVPTSSRRAGRPGTRSGRRSGRTPRCSPTPSGTGP
jgi:hypothetical protein